MRICTLFCVCPFSTISVFPASQRGPEGGLRVSYFCITLLGEDRLRKELLGGGRNCGWEKKIVLRWWLLEVPLRKLPVILHKRTHSCSVLLRCAAQAGTCELLGITTWNLCKLPARSPFMLLLTFFFLQRPQWKEKHDTSIPFLLNQHLSFTKKGGLWLLHAGAASRVPDNEELQSCASLVHTESTHLPLLSASCKIILSALKGYCLGVFSVGFWYWKRKWIVGLEESLLVKITQHNPKC